jgi:hypothetical protein
MCTKTAWIVPKFTARSHDLNSPSLGVSHYAYTTGPGGQYCASSTFADIYFSRAELSAKDVRGMIADTPAPSPLPTLQPTMQPFPQPSTHPTSFPTNQPTITSTTALTADYVESPLVNANVLAANAIFLKGVLLDVSSRRLLTESDEACCSTELSALRNIIGAQRVVNEAQSAQLEAQSAQFEAQSVHLDELHQRLVAQEEELRSTRSHAERIKRLEAALVGG